MSAPFRDYARERLSGRKVVAVLSGKGGVGKSTIAALTGLITARSGIKTLIIDLDFHGTSIARMFGIADRRHEVVKEGIKPIIVEPNLGIVSLRCIVGDKPIVAPGESIGRAVEELLAFIDYGDYGLVIIDMPPGMRDELLTLRRISVFTPILVTTPSQQALPVVEDLIKYLLTVGVSARHLVINMAYVKVETRICPFGNPDNARRLAEAYGLKAIELPIDPEFERYIGGLSGYKGALIDVLGEFVREELLK